MTMEAVVGLMSVEDEENEQELRISGGYETCVGVRKCPQIEPSDRGSHGDILILCLKALSGFFISRTRTKRIHL